MSRSKIVHLIFALTALAIAFALFARLKGWIRVVKLGDINVSDEQVANVESHDHIMPLTDEEYNLIRQNEETILILGNAPFADDTEGEEGLASMLEKASGAAVINCAVSGSYVGMTEPSFDYTNNPMNIFSPYYLACVACTGQDYSHDLNESKRVLGSSFPQEGEAVLETLKDLDIKTVDVIVFFYDGDDYLRSAPTGLDDSRYSDPFSTYIGVFSSTVELFRTYAPRARIIVMSAPYMYIASSDGTLEACEDHPNSQGADLSDYVLGLYRMCVESYDITFVDNYYTGIAFEGGDAFLTGGRYLNAEGRKLMTERLMYALTYYDEENLGNVDFEGSN
ncbi:MAG: SGNH/GDSL hydrolase family protein [Lachnospiraceae bacterium]|nr:SGNH/GDSL hydrolase family protein [Lachnospiraceae bacterium]